MRTWNLGLTDPILLTLAADARLAEIDPNDDQIWELALGSGEPRALAAETTYGLRARRLRLFPQFSQNSRTLTDPLTFFQTPRMQKLFPNWIRVQCVPFQGIDVTIDYRVPSCQILCGRTTLTNTSPIPRTLDLSWTVLLTPHEGGSSMKPIVADFQTLLTGQSEDLCLTFYLSGSPKPGIGAYPALTHAVTLAPGASFQNTWALAALPSPHPSIDRVRQAAAEPWDAALTRVELTNQFDCMEIETTHADWDAAFLFSQNAAFQALTAVSSPLPEQPFVPTRQPDDGWNPQGSRSQPAQLWKRQAALDALHLSQCLLPGAAVRVQGLIRSLLAAFSQTNSIGWKIDQPGQPQPPIPQPVLAELTWRCHTIQPDLTFLRECLPALLEFYENWFTSQHDRDGDGIPEWDHILQTGLENHPLHDSWLPENRGVNVTTVESPALGAFLVRETQALLQICRAVGSTDIIPVLQTRQKALQEGVESMWDAAAATYRYRDRDTHTSTPRQILWEADGDQETRCALKLDIPQRLQIRITSPEENTHRVDLRISGALKNHPVETCLNAQDIHWHGRTASATTSQIFSRIDSLAIHGLSPQDHLTLETVDHTVDDITLLLPLWAGIPNPYRAAELISHNLLNPARYQTDHGIPTCPSDSLLSSRTVYPLWNTLLIEGLLKYGFRKEAADIFSRLVETTLIHLSRDHNFYRGWDAITGQPTSERGNIQGIVPVSLFFSMIGVEWIGKDRILIHDYNPFPWNITLKYRGTTILRKAREALITFQTGQAITVEGEAPQVVTLT